MNYDEEVTRQAEKSPLGIEPRAQWKATRLDNLRAAIDRYMVGGMQIPIHWIEEYNELIKELI